MTVRIVTTAPRRNNSPVVMGERSYVFVADKNGKHIADVDEKDAAILLRNSIYYKDGEPARAPTAAELGFRPVPTTDEGPQPPVNENTTAGKSAANQNPWLSYTLDELRAVYTGLMKKEPGTLQERGMANQLLKAGFLPDGKGSAATTPADEAGED